MITINIDPILLSFGHLAIRWYGIIVGLALMVGIWVGSCEARRKGIDAGVYEDLVMWVVVAGLIGARLFHVIDHWPDEYRANPLRALFIWEGGLAIWGAVLGGLVGLAIYASRRKLHLGRLVDTVTPGLILAQAIGRVACIITGDAVGKPTTGPFGLAYTRPDAMVPQLGVYYTPMPVYEIAANLAIFALIWQLRKKGWPDGLLFLAYLGLYSIERFALAFTSSYRIVAVGMTQSQIVALLALAVALPWIAWMQLHRPRIVPVRRTREESHG